MKIVKIFTYTKNDEDLYKSKENDEDSLHIKEKL